MDARQFLGGRYLKKEDFPQPKLLTVARVHAENVAPEGQPEERKLVMKFRELEKPMALNATNGQLCGEMFGTWDTDGWIGRQIVVYTNPDIMFGGKRVGGLCVRAPKNRSMAQPAQMMQPPSAPVQPDVDDGYGAFPEEDVSF